MSIETKTYQRVNMANYRDDCRMTIFVWVDPGHELLGDILDTKRALAVIEKPSPALEGLAYELRLHYYHLISKLWSLDPMRDDELLAVSLAYRDPDLVDWLFSRTVDLILKASGDG